MSKKRITRIVGGMTLVARSPSHYHWVIDPKLEFKYDGAGRWLIIMPGRAKAFDSLREATDFCLLQIYPMGRGA